MTLINSTKCDNNLVTNIFPLGMKNSELVIKDDEENITELEDLSSSVSEQNFNPTAINIEDSKDVIIGPVTQFHGPVTIYQNVNGTSSVNNITETNGKPLSLNGKLVKSESTSSEVSHTAPKSKNKFFIEPNRLKYIGISVIIIIILIIIITSTVILLRINPKETPPSSSSLSLPSLSPQATVASIDDEDITIPPRGPGVFIDKKRWRGYPSLNNTKPLHHPTRFVIISHTVTRPCHDVLVCSQILRSIQAAHVASRGFPDIDYNFLIGGDGNVYVARGWDIQNNHTIRDSIAISFIGNYVYEHLTDDMIKTTKMLLEKGIELKKLDENYILIGQNQTKPTESPGPNIYRVIKQWPHFDPRPYI